MDSDNEMVSVTFNAMQHLVPLLGANVIVGGGRQSQFVERGLKVFNNTLVTEFLYFYLNISVCCVEKFE